MNVDGIIIDSVSTSAKDKSYELILKHQETINLYRSKTALYKKSRKHRF